MPANIGGAITPENATTRSRPRARRNPCSHVTKTKTLRPTRYREKVATRKNASPVAAEIAIQRRWLLMENYCLVDRCHREHVRQPGNGVEAGGCHTLLKCLPASQPR